MSKHIELSPAKWEKLRERLKKDYSPSVMLIRSKMRNTLGFVDREYQWYTHYSGYQTKIYLDFYNEPKRTMFLLKYSEYLDKTGITDS